MQDTSTLTISANKTVIKEEDAPTSSDKKDQAATQKQETWHRTERLYGSVSRWVEPGR
jgi:hypothetical protein